VSHSLHCSIILNLKMSSPKITSVSSNVANVIFKSFNTADLKTSEAVLAQQNHLYVDLCFVCADFQKIRLHKLVIGCADGFLAELLGSGFDNNEEATIIFPDVDGEDLITVVSAIYTGFCWVPDSKVEDLKSIVEMLKLPLVFENSKIENSLSKSDNFQEETTGKIKDKDNSAESIPEFPVYEIEYVQIEELNESSNLKKVKPRRSLLKRNLPCLETTVVYKRSKESNTFNRAEEEVRQDEHYEIEPCNKVIPHLEQSTVGGGSDPNQYKLKDFQCVQCDFKSFLKEEIICHKKTAHPTPKHKCSLCTKTFSRKNDLTRHLMLHSGERKYACTFCESKFIGSGDLHKHVRIHTGERPHKCEFENCTKSFTQKGDLNKHVKIHLKIKNHKCHLCGYSCIQGSDLSNHMLTHTNSKPFPCDLCFKSFRRNNQLSMHMKRFHPTYVAC